jgi:hypothetical protein
LVPCTNRITGPKANALDMPTKCRLRTGEWKTESGTGAPALSSLIVSTRSSADRALQRWQIVDVSFA